MVDHNSQPRKFIGSGEDIPLSLDELKDLTSNEAFEEEENDYALN